MDSSATPTAAGDGGPAEAPSTAGVEGSVRLEGVTKQFGDFVAVESMDLEIEAGEFFTMLGPSGCGKTTTLRMIAGFEEPTEGEGADRRRVTSPAFPRTSALPTPSSRATRSSRT